LSTILDRSRLPCRDTRGRRRRSAGR
jgi:hypothetical protein